MHIFVHFILFFFKLINLIIELLIIFDTHKIKKKGKTIWYKKKTTWKFTQNEWYFIKKKIIFIFSFELLNLSKQKKIITYVDFLLL